MPAQVIPDMSKFASHSQLRRLDEEQGDEGFRKKTSPSIETAGFRTKAVRAPSVASSSVANMYSTSTGFRLKRTILLGRRVSPSTPLPSWKVADAGLLHKYVNDDAPEPQPHQSQWTSVSARKLAASLWELQEVPLSGSLRMRASSKCDLQQHIQSQHDMGFTDRHLIQNGQIYSPASSRASERSYLIPNKIPTPGYNSRKTLRDLKSRPIKAQEMTKMFMNARNPEEQESLGMPLITTLQCQLDQAYSQIQELLLSEKAYRREFENMKRSIAQERALWHEQQEENIRLAVQSMRHDLENERMLKQRLEMLHKRVARDLYNAKKILGKTLQDLNKERKARELMEDVCDELAKEIGEDKARVEELKRESMKVREEVEEERRMLQMAEVWREERVQMKLMEAKLQLEEKNAALDKLRNELEAFLKAKRAGNHLDESNLNMNVRTNMYRHSVDTALRHHTKDPFLLVDTQGVHESSADSGSLDSHICNVIELGGEGSDHGDDATNLRSMEPNKGLSSKHEDNDWTQQLSIYQNRQHRGRRSINALDKPKLSRVEKHQLQGSQIGLRDGDHIHDDSLETHKWIDRTIEGGDMTDITRNHCQNYELQTIKEDMEGHRLRSYVGTPDSGLSQSNSILRCQMSNAPSSPTGTWNYVPDRGSPLSGRPSNASNGVPKVNRASHLKEKLLEAKIEGPQQGRTRHNV